MTSRPGPDHHPAQQLGERHRFGHRRGRLARPWLAVSVGAALALVLFGRPGADAAEYTVDIQGLSFNPEEITVAVGDTITWVNRDSDHHDLQGGPIDSPELAEGDRYTAQFTEAQDVIYHCNIHTYMQGTVHVLGPGGEPPPSTPSTTAPPPPPTTTTTAPRGLVPFLPVGSPGAR